MTTTKLASFKDQMDFSREVDHPDVLIVRGEQPFNAEPPIAALVEYGVTPEELVYCRNHSAFSHFPYKWEECLTGRWSCLCAQ